MKRLWLLFLALVALAVPIAARGQTRENYQQGIIVPPSWLCMQERFVRDELGSRMFDALGDTQPAFYANLTVNVASGMNVTVSPAAANSQGSLYQYIQSDTNIFCGATYGVGVDTTMIPVRGNTTVTSALIPVPAPTGAGQSQYYLIEGQVEINDTTPSTVGQQTQPFSTPVPTLVNRDRADQIAFQAVAGTPASSPTPPAADSGWVGVGQVLVTYEQTQVGSGNITMLPAWSGYALASSAVTSITPGANMTGGGAGPSPSPVGLVTPTPSACPSSMAGFSGSFVLQYESGCAITSITAGSNMVVSPNGGPVPTVALTNAPNVSGPMTASEFIGSGAGLTSATVPNAALVTTPVTTVSAGTNLTGGGAGPTPSPLALAVPSPTSVPSVCLGENASNILQSFNCSNIVSGVSSITATSPITASASTGAVTIACATCVTSTPAPKSFFLAMNVPGTITATPLPWVRVTYNETALQAVGDSVYCQTSGTSGTNTVKWQYVTATDPNSGSPTITDLTGSSMSWTTAGGTSENTFTAINLTTLGVTYVRPNMTAVGASPPSNCQLYLDFTH